MLKLDEKHQCCGCQACAQICPQGCIAMTPDEEGFLYPVVDKDRCIVCGLCEKACPLLHSEQKLSDDPPAYAVCNLNEEIRMESSSGGFFTLLAEYVLAQNGVVYGAAMEGCVVKHIRAEDELQLSRLRGSKYVQSDIGNAYVRAKQDLEAGRTVLFTGTPCQIEGLKAFLRRDYERLLCMDIICHGVPSPVVFHRYAALREEKAGSAAKRISFRHKKHGWKDFAMAMEFADHSVYLRTHGEDPFMRVFLRDLCLRPSCYQCGFKKINRISDFTAADFWGISAVCPEMNDDKGASLVIVHSEKGRAAFEALRPNMRCREVDVRTAIRTNPAMLRSAAKPKQRDAFMRRIGSGDFEKLAAQYAGKRVSIKNLAKNMLRKFGVLERAKKIKARILH